MANLKQTLLVTDLDGTLLPHTKVLSPVDLAAIARFREKGGQFTIATGRTLEATRTYLEALSPTVPVILYNGTMLYDWQAQTPLAVIPLPDTIEDVVTELMAFDPDMGVEILTADQIYVVRLNDYERRHVATCNVTPVYAEFDAVPRGGWLKVLFALSPEGVNRLEAHTTARGDADLAYVRSADIFLEILPAEASKGTALRDFRDRLCDANTTIYAAGDYHNDLTMLQYADIGAAPANAQEVVKEAADLVLSRTCNEGAIAELIDRILQES